MIVSLFGILFIFLYLYSDFIRVSTKIQDNIDKEIEKEKEEKENNIRDNNDRIHLKRDDDCLYNHQNLCQKMLMIE